jgi:CRISPR-associated protein Csm4
MSVWYVRLFFVDRVHFGSLGVGLESVDEILHSDSLYSALCHAWSARFGASNLTALLDRFLHDPPFLFSSAFPFLDDTFFLPKPLTPPPGFEQMEMRREHETRVKEAEYLTREHFSAWIHDRPFSFEELEQASQRVQCASHKTLIPRVALGRENNRSEIFHVAILRFARNAGLYFLLRLADETLLPQLRAALALLGEMGLGGERAYGLGRFTVHIERADSTWDFLEAGEGSRVLTLALFCPPESDLDLVDETCSYGLIERKGWIHSPFTYRQLKRKTVVMFTAGSVFSRPLQGQVLDVTPAAWDVASSHPIYRFGLPFFVHTR